jgi:hypothetical protein
MDPKLLLLSLAQGALGVGHRAQAVQGIPLLSVPWHRLPVAICGLRGESLWGRAADHALQAPVRP